MERWRIKRPVDPRNASALEKKKKIPATSFSPLPPLLLAGPKNTPPKINHVNGRKTGETSELTKASQLSDASALQAVPTQPQPPTEGKESVGR